VSKAKNQETTVETKNTEVKANLNGQEVILIIPVAKSGYQGLQSTKSKNKDKITLHFERNEVEKGEEEEIKKISQKYLELVKPFLTNLFKGFEGSISFTEANTLMVFDCGSHGERKVTFNLIEEDSKEEMSLSIVE
jgi:hypothetical protein